MVTRSMCALRRSGRIIFEELNLKVPKIFVNNCKRTILHYLSSPSLKKNTVWGVRVVFRFGEVAPVVGGLVCRYLLNAIQSHAYAWQRGCFRDRHRFVRFVRFLDARLRRRSVGGNASTGGGLSFNRFTGKTYFIISSFFAHFKRVFFGVSPVIVHVAPAKPPETVAVD